MKHSSLIASGIVAIALVVAAGTVSSAINRLAGSIEKSAAQVRGPVVQLIRSDDPIRPGDVVEVAVGDLEGPGVAGRRVGRVGGDGKISLPYLNEFIAGGSTPLQLEKKISHAYRDANIVNNAMVSVTAKRDAN